MGKDILSYDDLLQIVDLIKSSEGFSEFHMKVGEIELHLRRAGTEVPQRPAALNAPAAAPDAALQQVPAAKNQVPAPAAAGDFPAHAIMIKSPMVGTFYRRPEPGAKPFVEVGQKVAADSTVCIIEVMKLFNSIAAGRSGTVTHIMVNDAEAVDAGQILIVIDPSS